MYRSRYVGRHRRRLSLSMQFALQSFSGDTPLAIDVCMAPRSLCVYVQVFAVSIQLMSVCHVMLIMMMTLLQSNVFRDLHGVSLYEYFCIWIFKQYRSNTRDPQVVAHICMRRYSIIKIHFIFEYLNHLRELVDYHTVSTVESCIFPPQVIACQIDRRASVSIKKLCGRRHFFIRIIMNQHPPLFTE